MNKRVLYAGALLLSIGGFAAAQSALSVQFNGRNVGEAIRVRSKVYVSAESLRAMGLQVRLNGSTVQVVGGREAAPAEPVRPLKARPDAEGGANQQGAVEGRGGEWLFNGIFRFKVHSVERVESEDENQRGWKLKLEVRNGTTYNNYAPGGVGYEGMQLILKDGESVNFTEFGEPHGDFLTPGLGQGAGRSGTAIFTTKLSAPPVKLLFRVNPEGDDNIPPKFTVADPSFRVDLRNLL